LECQSFAPADRKAKNIVLNNALRWFLPDSSSAWARKRLGEALDAVGGIGSPGGCAVWHVAGLGQSVREWSAQEGWNGRTLNQYEAKGILVSALGVLAVHYGYAR
jgi:hypothetical protein